MGPEDFAGFIRLVDLDIDPGVLKLLPREVMEKFSVIPLWVDGEELVIACADPTNKAALRQIAIAVRRPIHPVLASITDIRRKLSVILGQGNLDIPIPNLSDMCFLLGHLSESDLKKFHQAYPMGDGQWRSVLESKLVGENDLAEAVGWSLGKPYVTRKNLSTAPSYIPILSQNLVDEYKIIPLWWFNGALLVGASVRDSGGVTDLSNAKIEYPTWMVIISPGSWSYYYRKTYLRGKPPQPIRPEDIMKMLHDTGHISTLDHQNIEVVLQQTGLPLDEVVVEHGLVARKDWLEARAQLYGVALKKKERGKEIYDQEIAQLLPAVVARSFMTIPLRRDDGKVIVGMYTPSPEIVGMIEHLTGLDVIPEMMDIIEIEKQLDLIYPKISHISGHTLPGFGKFLIALGYITQAELDETLSGQFPTRYHLGECLVSKGYLSDLDVAQALSLYTGLPFAHLEYARFEKGYLDRLPANIARQCHLIPIWAGEKDMWVATANPLDGRLLRIAEEAAGVRIWSIIAPRSIVRAAISRFYGEEVKTVDSHILRLIEGLVAKGILNQTGASKVLNSYAANIDLLDQAIVDASYCPENEVIEALASLLGIQSISLQLFEAEAKIIDPLGNAKTQTVTKDPVNIVVASLIDSQTARNYSALPVRKEGAQVVVAFANPEYHADLKEIESIIGEQVIPRLVSRPDLEEAIHRTLEKGNIGSRLLLAGLITRKQLNDALDLAKRTGVRLGHALVNRRYVSQQQLYQFLAEQANIPFGTLEGLELDRGLVDRVSAEESRANGLLPIRIDEGKLLVAVVDPLDEEAMAFARQRFNRDIQPILVTEQEMEAAYERLFSDEYIARSVSELLERHPDDSAYRVLSLGQKIGLATFVIISIIGLYFDYRSYFIFINILATVFYMLFSGYRFYLVYKAISRDLEIPVSDEEVSALDDRDLPVYTILIPVYKEAAVLIDLLDAIKVMDYPSTKLDIKVLMEADDKETIQTFRDWNPPSFFHGIIVPYAQPKTKPKACNYGLIHARGEYVVIYDAEDKPDPDQLKRILVAFSKAPQDVVCIQAKLNYYNRHQNLLTRWFTVEYSMWFDLFLPGLDASNAPIPLGGTSNHFKRDVLVEAGAWDPYNVTEDADLGIRIHKQGYRTAVVDSTTYEEANSDTYNWIRQRSRWIKGYIQTWLVHMRNPLRLLKSIGFKSFLSFQFVVGGTFFSALMNPIYWILTTLWFYFEWDFIQAIFPGIVFYFGAICLFIGNFAFTYMNVAGAMRRGYHDMVKHALLSPLYWGLVSVAAWRGFLQLITKPYFWEKTIHGLYESKVEPELGEQIVKFRDKAE